MKYKIFLFSILLSIVGTGSTFAQAPVLKDNSFKTEETYRVGEIRGNIKRKAIFLPKPAFPVEAVDAGADGIVKVEVVIDGEGNVISATAISGPALLKNAAEETARRTKFKSADGGQSVTETGVLIYNFAIEKAGWVKIGYDLSVIQKVPTLRPLNIPSIAKSFQPEWIAEMDILARLVELRRAEIEMQMDAPINDVPILRRTTQGSVNGRTSKSSSMQGQILIPKPPTAERIALSQNLIASLQSRLASGESDLWKFNLGINLIRAFELYRNPDTRTDAAIALQQSADIAPADISAEALAALKNLIKLLGKARQKMETENEIGRLRSILFKIK